MLFFFYTVQLEQLKLEEPMSLMKAKITHEV